MYKKLLVLLVPVFFLACKGESPKDKELSMVAQNQPAQLELLADGKLRFLELSGSPYERGLAHGKALKPEIQEVIRLFKKDIAETTQEDPDAFIAKFLALTDYKASVEKWMPESMMELKGSSEGSGVDFETIFMHQLGDEYWFNAKDVMAHSCSSFGVDKSADLPSITAQNMDIPEYYHGFQTVLKIDDPDSGKEIMVLTIPGHLGITGMNTKLVSINCNTLMQLDYGKTGLPVTFIVHSFWNDAPEIAREQSMLFMKNLGIAGGLLLIIANGSRKYSIKRLFATARVPGAK